MRCRGLGPGAAAVALAAMGALLPARAVEAQACIGVPVSQGTMALVGHAGTTGDVARIGGDFVANLNGPLTLGFGYLRAGEEANRPARDTFSGRAALQMLLVEPMVCPVAGVRHTRWAPAALAGGGDVRVLEFPLGVGIGATRAALAPGTGVTLFAIPQVVFQRTTTSGLGGEHTATATEFEGEVGFRVGNPRFFGGASVVLSSASGADPLFGVSLGIGF
jgi:hypothetical protein